MKPLIDVISSRQQKSLNVKMMVQGEERMNELVSIIVPVHNGEAYLQDCVQSVLEQTYPNFEMIIIDDGSEDTTWSLCERIKKQITEFGFFIKKRRGFRRQETLDWIARLENILCF